MNPKRFAALLAFSLLGWLAPPSQAGLIANYEFTAGSELVDSTGTTGNLIHVERGTNYTISNGYLRMNGFDNLSTYDYLKTVDFNFTSANAWSVQFDARDYNGGGGPNANSAAVVSSKAGAGTETWQINDRTSGTLTSDSGQVIGSLSDTNWHTVLLVHQAGSSTVTAYFDGTAASITWATGRVNLNDLSLGIARDLLRGASVDIDNVRIWNTAVAPPNSMIAEYLFESGSQLTDSTGFTGPLVPVDRGTAGITDYTVSGGFLSLPGFDSVSTFDYLKTSDFNFTSSAAWAVSFDLRDPGGAGGPRSASSAVLSSQSAAGSTTWQLNNNTDAKLSESSASPATLGNLSDGLWHSVTLSHAAGSSTLTAYFDGVAVPLTWGSARVSLDDLTFASRSLDIQASVDIDNLRVYNFAKIPPPPVPATVNSFTASDYYVAPGTTVTLNWSGSNGLNHTITTLGSVASSGSAQVVVNAKTTFEFTVSNGTSSASKQITVHVGPARPNLILILIDDFGITDTSVPFIYNSSGNPVSYNFNNLYVTPNMEALAASGMRFTQAYAQPVCSSTRASLMTGLNATAHRITSHIREDGARQGANSPRDYNMTGYTTPGLECLPRWLSNAGYRTIHCGKAHFTWEHDPNVLDPVESPTFIGFDLNIGGSCNGQPGSYLGTDNYGSVARPSFGVPGVEAYHGTNTFLTEALTIEATKALDESVVRGQPFFLYMSHYAVHAPFTIDPRATGNYSALTPGSDAHKFATMIEGMDKAVGELLTHVNSLPPGVAENTLVVFLGDNGSDNPLNRNNLLPLAPYDDFPLNGKKACRTEGGARVPLLVSWAKPDPANPFQQALSIPANSHEDDIVTCWDLPVTLMNVANVPIPVPVQGHDLSGYLRQTPGTHRPQEILLYYPHGRNGDYFANLRQNEWKLSYSFQNDTFRLYNLATDPAEQTDLAATNPAKRLEMARAMARAFNAEWGSPGPFWPYFNSADLPLSTASIMAALDLDGDGRIDAPEDLNANGLLDAGETNPDDSDSDDDGTDDQSEVRLGLDPLNRTSYFRSMIGPAPTSSFQVSWPSKPGLTFTIRHTSDLSLPASGWTKITGVPAAASGTQTAWTYSGPDTRRFFVIQLE